MIVRGTAGRKIPHSRVFENEKLYLMKKGTGKISANAIVKSVQNYTKLAQEDIDSIFKKNKEKLNLSAKQRKLWHKKCLWGVEFLM